MLLLAGSKISFQELYHKEIDLPVFKNKYYKAEDVDNLYVLINGMFTQVSEQAYRNNKALSDSRAALVKAQQALGLSDSQLKQVTQQAAKLKTANAAMQQQLASATMQQVNLAEKQQTEQMVQTLAARLKAQTEAYQRLLVSSAAKMADQTKQLEAAKTQAANGVQTLNELKQRVFKADQAAGQQAKIATQLQSKLAVLSDKYRKLKASQVKLLAKERIQQLQHEKL